MYPRNWITSHFLFKQMSLKEICIAHTHLLNTRYSGPVVISMDNKRSTEEERISKVYYKLQPETIETLTYYILIIDFEIKTQSTTNKHMEEKKTAASYYLTKVQGNNNVKKDNRTKPKRKEKQPRHICDAFSVKTVKHFLRSSAHFS